MSKGALNEILYASSEKFEILVKNVPKSEKPQILKFLQNRVVLLENLR